MRGLVQRVSTAQVRVDGEVVGTVGPGLCVLVGVTHGDGEAQAEKLARKIWELRIVADDDGVMNRSVADTTGEVLVISQFTLYADTRKGRRPSWNEAARPEDAQPIVDHLVSTLRGLGATVSTGVFGAHMEVELTNDGPVTLMLET